MLGRWHVCHAGGVRRRTLPLTDASHSPSSPSPLRVGMAGVGHDRPQDWIVGVALLRAAIERLAIEGAKRHIEIKPGQRSGLLMKGLPNATRSARPCAMASLARTLSKPLLAMKSPPKSRLIAR
jgi:hypothetical protein